MKFKKTALLICAVIMVMVTSTLFFACDKDTAFVAPDYADVYVTTGTMSKLMSRQTSLAFTDYTEDDEYDGISVTVNTDETYQDFYGYGATLTHSSAYLLTQEGAEDVAEEMLQELFGENGARLSLVRVPVGASDYIEGDTWFTCCDIEGSADNKLEHFSIEHDTNLIKVLKRIKQINPDVKIFACPWSAPAWMKNNNYIVAGTLKEQYYDTYADYLVKFIEAYKAQGIDIDYLSLVNEPYVGNVGYPSMLIDAMQAIPVGALVLQKLDAKGLSVKLLGWEHNVNGSAEAYIEFIEEENIFSGISFHGYTDVNLATIADGCDFVRENYPNQQIFMTEITEHTGSNDFANNLSYAARYTTLDPINHGLNGSMFWNLVLRPDGSPTNVSHNENECYGVLDMDYQDGEFIYSKRSAYYSMAHVSKFAYPINGVYPKALMTESSNETQVFACALMRADGAIIVSAVNASDQIPETVHIVIGGKKVSIELQPQSVVTIVC